MRAFPFTLAAIIALTVFSAGSAQTPAFDDPEATVVAPLTVTSSTGPAWWYVSRGEAEVWILGTPAALTPTDLAWDSTQLERSLTGARALILPPSGSISVSTLGPARIARMIPGLRWTNGDIEKDLPPDMAVRFRQARTKLDKPASHYATPIPMMAMITLEDDYKAWAHLGNKDVVTKANALAVARRVPVEKPPTYQTPAMTATEVDPKTPAMTGCFNSVIDEIETPPSRFQASAEGWARGDVRAALDAPRIGFDFCINSVLAVGYSRYAISEETKAIVEALGKPGVTVALVPLRQLLSEQGVLHGLRKQGFVVDVPVEKKQP